MLIDRKSRPWIVFALVLFLISTALYIPYARKSVTGPHGGSWPGLAYGIGGSLIIVFAMALALKKKVLRTMRIGRAYTWLQGHVWLSLVSYPMILYHAGFAWGGTLTQVLMWAFTIVVISGAIGVILQQYIPTKLLRDVPRETIYEQIHHIVTQLRSEADEIVAAAVQRKEQTAFEREVVPAGAVLTVPALESTEGEQLLQAFYTEEVQPLLNDKFPASSRLSAEEPAAAAFRSLRDAVPVPLREAVDDLKSIVDERRQLDRQRRLHHVLHGWLFVHVPASYVMFALAIIHAVWALKYTSVGR